MADRFWAKVDQSGECWEWQAATVFGYGVYRLPLTRRNVRAHRYAYEQLVGPIPDGLDIDHLCRNRRCVRPSHLEPVTRGVNVLRGEGSAAMRARQKLCKRGHEIDRRDRRTGWRWCSQCKALTDRQRSTKTSYSAVIPSLP